MLTGVPINNESDVIETLNLLHSKGVSCVILSSVEINGQWYAVGSQWTKKGFERFKVELTLFPTSFTGTGDLFSSLILAWMAKTQFNLKESMEKTLTTIHHVLARTYRFALQAKGGLNDISNLELKLIQSKIDIEEPQIINKAVYF